MRKNPKFLNLSKNKWIFVLLLLVLIAVASATSIFSPKKEVLLPSREGGAVETPSIKYVSPISIEYLRGFSFDSPAPTIEKKLTNGNNYEKYIASYISEGNKIYGLLTIPTTQAPDGGYPAIVFNHGYIPPEQYVTTEKYNSYVDALAREGFVVFKIDFRGHGNSEGIPSGTYFSSAYTIDAISALKSLQKMGEVNANRIGMWGHSMAGNLVLRAMLVNNEIKAGVIWAGAVYSYKDFAKYGIQDSSYRQPSPDVREKRKETANREESEKIQELRDDKKEVDFTDDFWSSISLTQNIDYLENPVQIHHSIDDSTVDIGYSRDLADILEKTGKNYEFYEYESGGHNIEGAAFNAAMGRTVSFFKENL